VSELLLKLGGGMSVPEHLLEKAITLFKNGQRNEARVLCKVVIEVEPENDNAWFWFIRTLSDRQERIAAAYAWTQAKPESKKANEVYRYLVDTSKSEEHKPSAKIRSSRLMAWSLLMLSFALTFVIVVPLYNNMSARAEALENQVIILGTQNDNTYSDYLGLWNEYASLQQEFHVLTGDYSMQDTNMVEMRANYDRLKADHNELLREYAQLHARYNMLTDQFRSYQGQAVAPPFISIEGRNINLAFSKLDGTAVHWSIPVDRYELDVERGIRTRAGLFNLGMPVLRLTDGPDQEVWVTDFRDFMDPSPFVTVMTDIYEAAPDDRTFITEAWHIVGQMIHYVFEEDEIPRFPLETLVGGGGDCEDTAVLFASMIKAAPVDWKLELVYMNSKSPTDPMGFSDHVIVFIDTGLEHYYIETTRTDVMEPYTDGVVGWFVSLD
jgi:hypothetical protein